MYKFHRKCGDRVTLHNQNLTAIRNFVEFNHGLILSAEPLANDVLFEVRIDRKVNVWNGSLEIGVTTLDPDVVDLPATATKLRNTAWILSGNSIVKDGTIVLNTNWPEMDSLQEGDSVAVSRTNKAELMFFINGRCLGVAAKDLPERLFAVIDLYGQCVQVSIVYSNYLRSVADLPYESTTSEPEPGTSAASLHQDDLIHRPVQPPRIITNGLQFHHRCGILVELSNYHKTAARSRPLDDYTNGVVMTHRPIRDEELFEIQIDQLVDKWSGSIEVGVTSHDPATLHFPSTMTIMDSGTIMMSGCKILINGQGALMEYGNFNLDELRVGDTVGVMRTSNGELHFYINGIDQGVATDQVPPVIWGVVDLYGMTVKVTVVDGIGTIDSNLLAWAMAPAPEGYVPTYTDEPNPALCALTSEEVLAMFSESDLVPSTSAHEPAVVSEEPDDFEEPEEPSRLDETQLLFHTLRDSNVIIINNGRTAHRPNAFEVFNNGFVMTNRTLKTNELFQVRLDLVIPQWAGSIEIGITQHSSNDIVTPFRMNMALSGTWCIAGEDVIRDGFVIIPRYVQHLSRLVEGDTIGVMRKEMGILHFFLNGIDQGPAAFNIPEHVFGIIDLYGRVAQATIVDNFMHLPPSSPESPMSFCSIATVLPEMCFHRVHGHNARLSRNRLVASRATVYSEFNDAVLFSSRPLRECDMFEIRIDKMVDCWIGSLEIGVTAIRPDDLEANGGIGALAGTATDLSWDTYILSGSAMMKDGECIRSGYPLDLDTLTVGSRVGMMWHADRSLHYYLDGMDMGKAWCVSPLNIYAVVDLYGQCTQVTIMQNEERAFNYNGCNMDHGIANPGSLPTPTPPYSSFSEYHGDNVSLSKDYTFASRIVSDPMGALVFSSTHLIVNELYEVQIVECKHSFAGGFRLGVTDINVLNANINRRLPVCVSWLPHFTAYIDGKYIKYSRPGPTRKKTLQSFEPSFDWLRPGDRIGLKKTEDSKVLVYYNSELLDVAFENVPDKVYVLMEMYGSTTKIQTVSRGINVIPGNQQTIPNDKPETTGASTEGLSLPKTQEEIAPVMLESDETSEMADEQCDMPPTPPQSDLPEDNIQPDPEINNSPGEANVYTMPDTPVSMTHEDCDSKMTEVKSRAARPYTFHFVTGNNIRLYSSDTVALRCKGYSDGVAVASQPLLRGTSFRFRVDKISDFWEGTVAIGALAMLPTETLPSTALHFNIPCWVVTNELLYTRGVYTTSEIGRRLDDITENSVLTLHFRNNNDLTLEIDGTYRSVIDVVPRRYNEIYPVIDLYGKVVQVSILLHPHVILGGTSLDLPNIEEKQEVSPDEDLRQDVGPDSDSEPEGNGCGDPYVYYNATELVDFTPSSDETDDDYIYHSYGETRSGDYDTHSDDDDQSSNAADESNAIDNSSDLVEDSNSLVEVQEIVYEHYEPIPGPSSAPDEPQTVLNTQDSLSFSKDAKNSEIKARSWLPEASLDQSLRPEDSIVADNDLAAESRGLKKSQSSHHFSQNAQVSEEGADTPFSEDPSSGDSMVNPLSLGSHILDDDSDSPDEIEETCDTNIRHNDRYPEANEFYESCHDNDGYDASDANDDNFENMFMDAMFLETSNMPDLNEEQSLSFDDSTTTRRDDFWVEGLSVENLHYLNGIICCDQRAMAARIDHPDWVFYSETNGNCEVMHFALKFWNQIVAPYSDMRDVVTSGNVHCFCPNCHPDANPLYSGWVRIERAKPQEATSSQPVRMYWHVVRATITSALALHDADADIRRPRNFCCEPSTSPTCADTWIDDEGKPHQAALALDVDISGEDPVNDRLLAYWIYLRSHASMLLEAEDIEDTVGDAVDIEQDAVEDIVEDAVDDIDTLLDDDEDEESIGEAAVALIDDTNDLDEIQSETEPQIRETDE